GEALGGQAVQDRVDLAVALVPEVGDRPLDQLLHVVPGHRAEAQHAEDRVPARVRLRRCRQRALSKPTPRLTTLTARSTAPAQIRAIARPGLGAVLAMAGARAPAVVRVLAGGGAIGRSHWHAVAALSASVRIWRSG